MRIPTVFGQTTKHFSSVQEEPRKYILAYEGNRTEVQYFNGIFANRAFLHINPILKIIPLLRSTPDDTSSHPKKIFKLLEEHLDQYKTVKVLTDIIVDYIVESQWYGKKPTNETLEMRKDFQEFIFEHFHLSQDDEITDLRITLEKMAECIDKWCNPLKSIDELISYIEEQQIYYIPNYDKICIIIDRNKRNLKDYKAYLQKCRLKGYSLYVSNPDFEFWLLLHSNKVFDYQYELLFKNAKIDIDGRKSSKRYLENVLSSVFDGYKKENIRFQCFLPLVDIAINNEKKFCEDIEDLESTLGSNIGCLLEEMRKSQ